MTRLVLVRHGAHDMAGVALAGRLPHVSLNVEGRAQASSVARALAGAGIAALYSSPQRRTRETAVAIALDLVLAVLEAAEFDEFDFGDWTGRSMR